MSRMTVRSQSVRSCGVCRRERLVHPPSWGAWRIRGKRPRPPPFPWRHCACGHSAAAAALATPPPLGIMHNALGWGVTDGSHRWRWRDRGRLEGTESSRRGWGEARASPSSGHGLRCPTSDTVKSSPHPRTPPNPFTLPTPRESSPSYHVKYQS